MKIFPLFVLFAFPCLWPLSSATAQIIPDTTLGDESSVFDATTQRIGQGAIRGNALFHSFQEFNVNEGQEIYFANPAEVFTILSRVTGNNQTDISGTLGVLGPANLYVLNPNGIVFGPNAKLDVAGSFMATTADAFTFADGSVFSANGSSAPDTPPLLTMNVTPGLQYGTDPQSIVNHGRLENTQDLTLSGGTVTSNGSILSSGEVIVESVAGDVRVNEVSARTALLSANGDLVLNGSNLETSGNLILNAAGNIQIQDSISDPFVASAGVDLIVEANQSINTLDLSHADGDNHPASGLIAGRDLIVRSPLRELGDRPLPNNPPLYRVGSYFRTEQLDGTVIDAFIPYDDAAVVRTTGDIEFSQDYTGRSLYVLTDGQISATDTVTTIEQNPTDFGTVTAPLADGNTITLQSSYPGTIDIRTGQAAAPLLSELIGNTNLPPINITTTAINQVGAATGSDIDLSGLLILSLGGGIALGNQSTGARPDDGTSHLSGDIIVGEVGALDNRGPIVMDAVNHLVVTSSILSDTNSASRITASEPGAINLWAGGNLSTTLGLVSSNAFDGVDQESGDITLWAGERLNLSSTIASISGSDEDTGDSGNITLLAGGDLTIDARLSTRSVLSTSASNFGQSGQSGDVTLRSGGSINTTNELSSISGIDLTFDILTGTQPRPTTAEGSGNITLWADGTIDNNNALITSTAFASLGVAGDSGRIAIAASQDIVNSQLLSRSTSSSGDSSNSQSIFASAGETIRAVRGLSLSIPLTGIEQTGPRNVGNTGDVIFSAGKTIEDIFLFSIPFTEIGNTGNAGDVYLLAPNGSIEGGFLDPLVRILTFAVSGNEGAGGAAGNGGDVIIDVQDSLSELDVFTVSSGNTSGDIFITSTDSLNVTEFQIVASAQTEIFIPLGFFGITIPLNVDDVGQSGNVQIRTSGDLTFEDVQILSDALGPNPAGNVELDVSGQITLQDSAIVTSTNSASANAAGGNIRITAAQVNLDNSQLTVETLNAGEAGSVRLDTPILNMASGSRIIASTSGTGEAGRIRINASTLNLGGQREEDTESPSPDTPNTPSIRETVGIFSETQSDANAGEVILRPFDNDSRLAINFLNDGGDNEGEISASTRSPGAGGSIRLTAPEVIAIQGNGAISARTDASGRAGNIEIVTETLTMMDRAQLSTASSDVGQAGNIDIDVNALMISDNANITTGAIATGPAGNIEIAADTFTLDQGFVTASTGESQGGNIDLQIGDRLSLTNQSQITASTDTGIGGRISLNRDDASAPTTLTSRFSRLPTSRQMPVPTNEPTTVQVELSQGSAIATEASGTGTAGSIDLNLATLTLEDESTVNVSAEAGFAGNATIRAEDITLANGSSISAVTGQSRQGQDGAVINLNNVAFLFMENGSRISAEALDDANGGNVNIDATNGFIVTALPGNNDILATANRGNGGLITITTQGIYGFVQNQIQSDRISDLTATSNVGIDGFVLVNDLGIDPVQAAADLPTDTTPPPLAQGCQPGNNGRGEFVNIRRGGIPISPDDPISGDRPWEDIMPSTIINTTVTDSTVTDSTLTDSTLTEAETWWINNNGQVVLLSPDRLTASRLTCHPKSALASPY